MSARLAECNVFTLILSAQTKVIGSVNVSTLTASEQQQVELTARMSMLELKLELAQRFGVAPWKQQLVIQGGARDGELVGEGSEPKSVGRFFFSMGSPLAAPPAAAPAPAPAAAPSPPPPPPPTAPSPPPPLLLLVGMSLLLVAVEPAVEY